MGNGSRLVFLHQLAVVNPAATIFLRVDGESMSGAGIFPGDIVVVASVNEQFTIKRLEYSQGKPVLRAENPSFDDIVPRHPDAFSWVITSFRA